MRSLQISKDVSRFRRLPLLTDTWTISAAPGDILKGFLGARLENTMDRIGYFIPEFPSQTHIMFWREYQAMLALGMKIEFISSKRPISSLMAHSWSFEAEAVTEYLFPIKLSDLPSVLGVLVRAGPRKLWRVLKAVIESEGGLKAKLKLLSLVPFSAKLVGLTRRRGLAHVHVGSCGNAANVAMLALLLGGTSYSLSLLGPRLETYGPNQVQKWKYARFGLCQSKQLYEEAKARIGADLPQKVSVAPVGVDVDVMQRQTPFEPWPGQGPCRIYCCARLNPVKGHVFLIDAIKRLRTEFGVDAHLVLGGEDGDGGQGYRKVVEGKIEETGMTPHVTMLGAVSEENSRSEYAKAHVYAMASLDEAAGAVAAMEAMAMEVPVVMTNVGATEELIDDGVDGLIVPPGDPVAIADAIHALLRDPGRAMMIGKAGRNKIIAEYSHRRSASQIRQFLHS